MAKRMSRLRTTAFFVLCGLLSVVMLESVGFSTWGFASRSTVLRNLGDDVVGELFDGQKLSKILDNHLKNGGSLVEGG